MEESELDVISARFFELIDEASNCVNNEQRECVYTKLKELDEETGGQLDYFIWMQPMTYAKTSDDALFWYEKGNPHMDKRTLQILRDAWNEINSK